MMKYSTYTWDLVQAFDSASATPCKTAATLIPSVQTINQKNAKNPEMKLTPNKSYRIGMQKKNVSRTLLFTDSSRMKPSI